MAELEFDHLVLRYCRQIIMKTMDHVRSAMRGENRLHLKCAVTDPQLQKSKQNLTKAIDRDAEDLILDALQSKFFKLPGVKGYTVFSEELGIKTFPEGAAEEEADLVVFIDPIDGTEFVEALQGGWSVRQLDRQIASLAYQRTGSARSVLAKDEILPADAHVRDPFVLEFSGRRLAWPAKLD